MYLNLHEPYSGSKLNQYCYFQQGKLIYQDIEEIDLFWDKQPFDVVEYEYIGQINSKNFFAANITDEQKLPENGKLTSIRALFGQVDDDLVLAVGLANQVLHWASRHRFCGKCGGKTCNKEHERAKICTVCETVYYPEINPAIIVAITKGNKILLGHANRFNRKFYSVLAGFLEIGETLEQCVSREVKEEVGIAIKNINYFGSQPWPFPSSMMIGFTAEWESGEIKIDPQELTDADWYTVDNLPPIPGTISIAGKLIRWFIEVQSGKLR